VLVALGQTLPQKEQTVPTPFFQPSHQLVVALAVRTAIRLGTKTEIMVVLVVEQEITPPLVIRVPEPLVRVTVVEQFKLTLSVTAMLVVAVELVVWVRMDRHKLVALV